MAWLNNKTARYASSTVHVTLPSGKVARGDALIKLPPGLNLILQGQAMAGEGNTTLDLERLNLDVGGMLGDGGRIEFRNMRVRNVRPSLASAAVHVFLMMLWLVRAGLCGAPPSRGRCLCADLPPHCGVRRARDHVMQPVTSEDCIAGSVACCVVARRMLYVAWLHLVSPSMRRIVASVRDTSVRVVCCIGGAPFP